MFIKSKDRAVSKCVAICRNGLLFNWRMMALKHCLKATQVLLRASGSGAMSGFLPLHIEFFRHILKNVNSPNSSTATP